MRLHDWPKRMAGFIASRRAAEFSWGDNDCASFPADLGVAMGCADFLAGLRGYDNEFGAASTLVSAGYASLQALAEARLTPYELPTLARRGDVGLLVDPSRSGIYRYTLCVFEGSHVVGPGEFEMVWRPRSEVTAAYRLE